MGDCLPLYKIKATNLYTKRKVANAATPGWVGIFKTLPQGKYSIDYLMCQGYRDK
jgi:hypothetical protein